MTTTRCHIVPPHLLRRLARDADPRVAQIAERTLLMGNDMVARREVRAARSGPRRDNLGGTGLLPPDVRDRGRAARPAPTDPTVVRPEPTDELQPDSGAVSPKRSIYDAQRKQELPGVLVRSEGEPPVADESVNEAYDGLGQTFALFAEEYDRNSLDDQGLPLTASVHYGVEFDNAFWDGEQMVFGDGDGEFFNSFTDSVDVIAHELVHGFIQFTAAFTYVGQSGALNESVSDVFGSLVKQRVRGETADQADWLIGESLFTDKVQGVALRSLKAPGTAYDDPTLGKDPQPATMDDYAEMPHDEQNDNGGVHINSGIPNHAFYLAATAIGGNAWERAGQVWYDAMTRGGLPKDADFAVFAQATVTQAGERFGSGSPEQQAVERAWQQVKVL
ncbi:thermolysin metallopeptidase-like protein [Barrientosiimonas humi]|uniref:Neutral metalloproteinase n=1 Tax=Barrientosiimonas humi TaxID=999931 RepID=A0A542XCM0_9MICO|nr:M4 family metallopeptidase [Barrientosiimonas humi]TQL33558.1 thermolysin metallopeptidase-like protein [Barrientosiimonas humi]CAG7573546.1 Protease PrtS [Barrientosiimonas humi]